MPKPLVRAGLMAAALFLAGCLDDPKEEEAAPEPLAFLLGGYAGDVERLMCQAAMPDTCLLFRADSFPGAKGSLLRDSAGTLRFFIEGIGSLRVIAGAPEPRASADTTPVIRSFSLPVQRLEREWTQDEKNYEHVEAQAVRIDSAGALTVFTLRPQADAYLLTGPRYRISLRRLSP
jgi:hypothetical protein